MTNSISSGAVTGTAYSAATVKISAPSNTAIPVISGTLRIGSTQTTTTGTWPNTTTTSTGPQTYQWERSADAGASWTVIAGATGISYVTVAGDSGYRFRARETLTTNTGSSSTYTLTSLNPIV